DVALEAADPEIVSRVDDPAQMQIAMAADAPSGDAALMDGSITLESFFLKLKDLLGVGARRRREAWKLLTQQLGGGPREGADGLIEPALIVPRERLGLERRLAVGVGQG